MYLKLRCKNCESNQKQQLSTKKFDINEASYNLYGKFVELNHTSMQLCMYMII